MGSLLPSKRAVNKAPDRVHPAKLDKQLEKIHDTDGQKESVKLVRASVDLSPEMHKAIKRKMLDQDIPTLREYMIRLVQKDLQ